MNKETEIEYRIILVLYYHKYRLLYIKNENLNFFILITAATYFYKKLTLHTW